MFNLRVIVRKNADTYYDYRTSKRQSRRSALATIALIATAGSALVGQPSDNFLSGALSAQSILVGFSFNVLFYLVANRLTAPKSFVGLEHELRFQRLTKLSDEIFDNVSYLNVVAILSVFFCLAELVSSSSTYISRMVQCTAYLATWIHIQPRSLEWVGSTVQFLFVGTSFFLMLETIATFVRTVGRVGFYFGMLKTMKDGVEEAS